MGGLGVRKVSSLALSAYLASAASTASLQNTFLEPVTTSEVSVSGILIQMAVYSKHCFTLPTKQYFWHSPGIIQARQQVEESKSDAT